MIFPPRENILFAAGLAAGIFLLAWLIGCTPAEADTHAQALARQELRRDAAAAQACPPGHVVLWIDHYAMECRREIKP